MGKIVIPQIDRRQVTTGAIFVGGAAASEPGQHAVGVATDLALAIKDTAIDIGVSIGEGAAAMSMNPELAGKCAAIGVLAPLNDPIKFYAGIDVDPAKGWATAPLVEKFGLTATELGSDACKAGLAIGEIAPTLAGGMITVKAGGAIARELGLKNLPEAKTTLGKAFGGAGKTATGLAVNYGTAKGLHAHYDDEGHRKTPFAPMPVVP